MRQKIQWLGLIIGPAIAIVVFISMPGEYTGADGAVVELGHAARATAAVGVWMAVWWLSEAIPVYATALLPLVLFPLLGDPWRVSYLIGGAGGGGRAARARRILETWSDGRRRAKHPDEHRYVELRRMSRPGFAGSTPKNARIGPAHHIPRPPKRRASI